MIFCDSADDKKLCTKCKEYKEYDLFHKDKGSKDGYCYHCKDCVSVRKKTIDLKNKNTDKLIPEFKKCPACDTVKQSSEFTLRPYSKDGLFSYCNRCSSERAIKWQKENPAKANARGARRKANKLQATPKWLTQIDYEFMEVTYAMAKVMTDMFGEKYHVDHIDPLQGKDVCGLHVPLNLQVLLAKDNLSKGNRPQAAE